MAVDNAGVKGADNTAQVNGNGVPVEQDVKIE